MNLPRCVTACILVSALTALGAAAEPELTPARRQELEKKAKELNDQLLQQYQRGDYAAATKLAEETLTLRRKIYPKDRYPQGHVLLAQSLNNLGGMYQMRGEYAKAEPFAREALSMYRALYPKEKFPNGHADLASSLNNLAMLLRSRGEYEKAESLSREALAMRRAIYPRNRYPNGHPDLAQDLSNLGGLLQDRGDYSGAAPLYAEAVAMQRALYPKEKYPQGHPSLAQSVNNLGGLYEARGDYGRAEPLYREALGIWRTLYPWDKFPTGHPDLAIGLNNLGTLLYSQGKYAEAEPLLREVLRMWRALCPVDKYPQGHPKVVLSLNNLGGLLHARGEYAKAEPFLREAVAMNRTLYAKPRYPQGHPALAASLSNLAAVLDARGEYGQAEALYREALAIRETLYPKERYPHGHPDLAQNLNNLGDMLRGLGEYAKGESLLQKAIAMRRSLYPKDKYPQGHPHLAESLNNLGSLHQGQGEYAKAEPPFRESLTMRQTLYPSDQFPQGHPDVATGLSNLGSLLQARGEYDQAEPLLRETVEMRRRLHPKDRYPQGHPDLARSLSNLGSLLQARGEYDQAEPYFRDALAMWKALYPKNEYPQGHPDVAIGLNNLGFLLHSRGENGQAEPLYREAVAMLKVLYPQGHPHLALGMSNLGSLSHLRGEHAKAEPLYREALEISQRMFARMADTASEAEILNFAASLPHYRDAYLSLTSRLPARATTYDLVWQSRSVGTRIVERRHLDLLASSDPAGRQLFLELHATRQRLARLLLGPLRKDQEQAKLVQKLSDEKEELEKRLVRQLRLAQAAKPENTAPAQLSQALPEGTAFIDFIRYIDLSQDPKVPGVKGEKRTPRYVAFIVPAGAAAVRVELGEAGPVEKAWAAWHRALTGDRPDRAAAAELARLVWQPLRAKLPARTRTVWLAPDGALTRVPWAALPGSKPGSVLLEEIALAVVPHGPFLLERLQAPPAAEKQGTLLAVGAVNYDGAPQPPRPTGEEAVALRAPAVSEKRAVWKVLPGTLREQRQVLAIARKALPAAPLDRSGAAASVDKVLADLPRARYAHFATHGFFADPAFRSALQVDEKQFERLGLERRTAGARSPLVLSGLVLAGANRPETPDRGILTAEAIVGLSLQGLDLAVLSACDTGLGEVAGGEGVFGLTRAFHIAGASNVIASLWQVDDEATAALMGLFYRNLWVEKKGPAEALRQAQLYLYRHPERIPALTKARGVDFTEKELPKALAKPTGDARAHPGRWAAFVLSGVAK